MDNKDKRDMSWQERWDANGWHKEGGLSENYNPEGYADDWGVLI